MLQVERRLSEAVGTGTDTGRIEEIIKIQGFFPVSGGRLQVFSSLFVFGSFEVRAWKESGRDWPQVRTGVSSDDRPASFGVVNPWCGSDMGKKAF